MFDRINNICWKFDITLEFATKVDFLKMPHVKAFNTRFIVVGGVVNIRNMAVQIRQF